MSSARIAPAILADVGGRTGLVLRPLPSDPEPGSRHIAPMAIVAPAPADVCLDALVAQHVEVGRPSDTERVVQARLGGYPEPIRKLERVDGLGVRYLWLSGPLPFVEERFGCRPLPSGLTEVSYRAAADPVSGVLGWARTTSTLRQIERAAMERLLALQEVLPERPRLRLASGHGSRVWIPDETEPGPRREAS